MATDWKMCLQCDSSNTSNQFTPQANLWMSRAQGQTTWNPAGSSNPAAVLQDNLYIEVTDVAPSSVTGKLVGYLIASAAANVTQTDVTPFRRGNSSSKNKLCVLSEKKGRDGTTWTWGPYTAYQTGSFELTFSAEVDNPNNEQSDSWEEDPEFDVDMGP